MNTINQVPIHETTNLKKTEVTPSVDVNLHLFTGLVDTMYKAKNLDEVIDLFGKFVIKQVKETKNNKKDIEDFNKKYKKLQLNKNHHPMDDKELVQLEDKLMIFMDSIDNNSNLSKLKNDIVFHLKAWAPEMNVSSSSANRTKSKKAGNKNSRKSRKSRRNKSSSSNSRSRRGGGPHDLVPRGTPRNNIMIYIILYLFAVWAILYFYMSRTSETFQFNETAEVEELRYSIYYQGMQDSLSRISGWVGRDRLSNMYDTLHMLVSLFFSSFNTFSAGDRTSRFHIQNFVDNPRRTSDINNIRLLFCDIVLLGLFILVILFYGARIALCRLLGNVGGARRLTSELSILVEKISLIKWLINCGWGLFIYQAERGIEMDPGRMVEALASIVGYGTPGAFDGVHRQMLSPSEFIFLGVWTQFFRTSNAERRLQYEESQRAIGQEWASRHERDLKKRERRSP
tara:strand:+ start:1513 stop:2877 length:1365 start_codon:yes stop_codon:yes gene_type:complete